VTASAATVCAGTFATAFCDFFAAVFLTAFFVALAGAFTATFLATTFFQTIFFGAAYGNEELWTPSEDRRHEHPEALQGPNVLVAPGFSFLMVSISAQLVSSSDTYLFTFQSTISLSNSGARLTPSRSSNFVVSCCTRPNHSLHRQPA
jgi:hypothetical protein